MAERLAEKDHNSWAQRKKLEGSKMDGKDADVDFPASAKCFGATLLLRLLSSTEEAQEHMLELEVMQARGQTSKGEAASHQQPVHFFLKVVLPLLEEYVRSQRLYFLSVSLYSDTRGSSASKKEKEMIVSLFCKIPALIGNESSVVTNCLQVLARALDARSSWQQERSPDAEQMFRSLPSGPSLTSGFSLVTLKVGGPSGLMRVFLTLQNFKWEEQNYVVQNHINNLAFLSKLDYDERAMKKKGDRYSVHTSLIMACVKRLLPVGLRLCLPGDWSLVSLAKSGFAQNRGFAVVAPLMHPRTGSLGSAGDISGVLTHFQWTVSLQELYTDYSKK
ncbi:ryanodine receptor 2-like [Nerophis ophidion]|uniref:ryanodine receptor 2-like n=1 Tax=Nerophis ophidion TaxID=159077 RepID=UPI002ADF4F13|nr:ryanodine receptor 2-like [Nerophis ophidion]